jgi:hypothetical protein
MKHVVAADSSAEEYNTLIINDLHLSADKSAATLWLMLTSRTITVATALRQF